MMHGGWILERQVSNTRPLHNHQFGNGCYKEVFCFPLFFSPEEFLRSASKYTRTNAHTKGYTAGSNFDSSVGNSVVMVLL